jgi:transcriptional regulator with XRE-family HTH domain
VIVVSIYDNIALTPTPSIGSQIRRLRKERSLSLSELARLANTSPPTMHRYETGWDRFELNTLRKIAAALGASLEVRLIPDPKQDPSASPNRDEVLELVAPLFWDRELEGADLDNHPDWVLGRVLMFGSQAQVRAVREYYGDGRILKAIRRREIDARTRNYWTLVMEEPCTPRS